MEKLKIFLSSRVNSPFVKLDKEFRLTDLRSYLRDELEKENFLGEQMLDVIINETDFDESFDQNAFDGCMDEMRKCHIIIILYNEEAGWSEKGTETNGICHEEFLVAVNEFSEMTFGINLSQYFDIKEKGEKKKKNDAFIKDFNDTYRHVESIQAKDANELKAKALKQIKRYILAAIQKSVKTQKLIVSGASTFGPTLDWSKNNYSQRILHMYKVLEECFDDLMNFESVIKKYHVIPDNMSVADARNRIQRPFLLEHLELSKNPKLKKGVVHFVGVYGNSTEIQVKNLVGYPDLIVIPGSFGFYLWDKTSHIQMFFINKCINPQTIRTRLSQVINWLNASREQKNIIDRAKARYAIIKEIDKWQKLS